VDGRAGGAGLRVARGLDLEIGKTDQILLPDDLYAQANRAVVLTVTTQTAMDLSATYVTEIGNVWPMRKIPDGPGEPAPVTGRHQYAWAATDARRRGRTQSVDHCLVVGAGVGGDVRASVRTYPARGA
jgi:hypothetical protein